MAAHWISLQQRLTQDTDKHKVAVIEEKLKTRKRHQRGPWGTKQSLISSHRFVSKINLNFSNQESTQRIVAEITMATVCHTILF